MAGVTHLAEAGDKEVVAAVVGRGVLLDVGKLHKLGEEKKEGGQPRGHNSKNILRIPPQSSKRGSELKDP